MKKLIYCALALAAGLFAASCQQENLEPVAQENTVTYTVEVPEVMTKASIGDGTNVNSLVYEVWKTTDSNERDLVDDGTTAVRLYQKTIDFPLIGDRRKVNVTLNLVKNQNYTVLFWAQNAEASAYETSDLTAVTYKKNFGEDNTDYFSNQESYAAFYHAEFISENSVRSKRIELKRPFAQINIATTNSTDDGDGSELYDIKMTSSKVTIKNVPTVFDVAANISEATADATGEKVSNGARRSTTTFVFKEAYLPGCDEATDEVLTHTVAGHPYEYAAMNYIFANGTVDVTYEINTVVKALNANTSTTAKVVNTVYSVPVKENYRTNIVGNLLTSKTDYEIIVDAKFEAPDELIGEGVVLAKDSDELVAALKRNEAHLVIDLVGTQTKAMTPVEFQVPVGAWTEKYYFGGDQTRTITINANGNKINFVHENTDWNYIRMVNDNAKWIINDATLTNSGKNDGPWNRHDIRFYNAVELNNVTSDKAIALLNDGELNNVTITEETGAYGLWITAQGQKVDINGLNITAINGGRGIAIKDQYIESPACVTLNVENAAFETAEKAAILVTSTEGAVITLKDIDITNVAEDDDFAVWVDEDRAADADKVVVKGGLCKVEGAAASVAATSAELLADLKVANQTVYLYPTEDGKDLKLEGKISLAEGVSLIGLGENPVPVFNDWGSNAFGNQAHFTNTYVENINFTNNLIIDAGIANGNVTFKNCVFGGHLAHQGVHFDSGNGIVVFDNCTFVGRNMLGSSLEKVIFNNCTFLNKKSSQTGADKWTGVNMWGKYEFDNCVFDTEAHCNVKCDGIEAAFNGCKFVDDRDITSLIWNGNGYTANITFDGNKYIAEGLMEDSNGNAIASSESGLKEALANGGTVILANPFTIDQSESNGYGKTGINMTNGGTLDGNGNELGAPGSTGTWDSAINTSGGTIKNIKITEGFRGIFIKKDTKHNEKLFLDNVYIDGTTYTISCDSGNGLGLDANACTFNGWTSYAKTIGEVAFTKCSFGEGNGYAYCRPYAPTEFVDCAFEAGYQVDPVAAVTFENCTLDGVALTAENLSTLVTSNIANATVK